MWLQAAKIKFVLVHGILNKWMRNYITSFYTNMGYYAVVKLLQLEYKYSIVSDA